MQAMVMLPPAVLRSTCRCPQAVQYREKASIPFAATSDVSTASTQKNVDGLIECQAAQR